VRESKSGHNLTSLFSTYLYSVLVKTTQAIKNRTAVVCGIFSIVLYQRKMGKLMRIRGRI